MLELKNIPSSVKDNQIIDLENIQVETMTLKENPRKLIQIKPSFSNEGYE